MALNWFILQETKRLNLILSFCSPAFLSRFRDDKGYVLYPQIGDRLDLICPPLDTARSTPEYEFYKLYLVSSREQADRCEVMGPPNIVLTCDEPTRERRFTIKFQEFSPNLWGHEFKSMHDYYIIGEFEGAERMLEIRGWSVCVCVCGRVCFIAVWGGDGGVVMIAWLISDCA